MAKDWLWRTLVSPGSTLYGNAVLTASSGVLTYLPANGEPRRSLVKGAAVPDGAGWEAGRFQLSITSTLRSQWPLAYGPDPVPA